MLDTNGQSIKIVVRYFAQARNLVGRKEEELEMQSPVRVNDAVSRIIAAHPGLHEMESTMRIIVNGRMTEENIILKNGDALALLPPVAGG